MLGDENKTTSPERHIDFEKLKPFISYKLKPIPMYVEYLEVRKQMKTLNKVAALKSLSMFWKASAIKYPIEYAIWKGNSIRNVTNERCPWNKSPATKKVSIQEGNKLLMIRNWEVIPQDVIIDHVLEYCDGVSIMAWKRVCKKWNEYIQSNKNLAKNKWQCFEIRMQDNIEDLMADYLIQISAILMTNLMWPNGEWESNGREISSTVPQIPHDYALLCRLAEMLERGKSMVDVTVFGTALDTHSTPYLSPIILKHDQVAISRYFVTDVPLPLSKCESEGGLALTTIKKLFRFPDIEKEYTGDEYESFFIRLLKSIEQLNSIHTSTARYRRLKQLLESMLQDVVFIQMSNYASEEVSLYFWLGRSGSYLAGYWWLVERES
jgi:hypothetical protein